MGHIPKSFSKISLNAVRIPSRVGCPILINRAQCLGNLPFGEAIVTTKDADPRPRRGSNPLPQAPTTPTRQAHGRSVPLSTLTTRPSRQQL